MFYLHKLKDDLLSNFQQITADKTFLQIVNGDLPSNSNIIKYMARFIFTDCRIADPFHVMTYIRHWFSNYSLPIPDINFDCDVIDLETYDLQIDILLNDKLNIQADGSYTVCPSQVWSNTVGGFVSSNIVTPMDLGQYK